jgi:hypothetical protein
LVKQASNIGTSRLVVRTSTAMTAQTTANNGTTYDKLKRKLRKIKSRNHSKAKIVKDKE